MIRNKETEELIERYCRHELTQEELRIFEQWLEGDEDLRQSVLEHQEVLAAFQLVARRHLMKQKLVSIHDEMEAEMLGFKSPLKIVEKQQSKIIQFYRKYRIISIAAAVTVFAVSGTLLTGALTGLFSTKQRSAYQDLRLEVEKLKRSQRAIIKGIQSSQEGPEEAESASSFIGSGFALNSNGYLLTSYHVVKDARKIYISNGKFSRLSAEIVHSDKDLDVAVLKVSDPSFTSFGKLPYSLKNQQSDPGEKVFTLGYPREDMVYNEGSVSSCSGFEGDSISYQVAIPVNPGNSGGPLFDNQANLIGIISGKNTGAEGASFAIQSHYIIDYLKSRDNDKPELQPGKNMRGTDRTNQIKKLRDFIFMVKVYN